MNFIFLDSVDSTQNIARKELLNCDFESSSILNPLVCAIIANNQSAGRGRLGRKWVSESGQSFLASYGAILPKSVVMDSKYNGWLPMIAGLCARDALIGALKEVGARKICEVGEIGDCENKICDFGQEIKIKWPNDIFIGDCKEGGILTEIAAIANHSSLQQNIGVIFGIGLNLNVSKESLPIEQATSLQMHYANLPDAMELRDIIAKRLAKNLNNRLASFVQNPAQSALCLREEVSAVCWTLGRKVSVYAPEVNSELNNGECVEGVAQSINDDASLLILKDSGESAIVHTGDVHAL
ncbi:biotin--acetyl-CoA-carboxylase ligase [Gardnerella vaginalis]|uniref:Biotin--[acetyl-CoA-carboxylase] ligase n=1 Tax=Gardnerella piotii TaxID=2792977 RepID=A0ABU5MRT4_9BIFI|nr:biotin--[acetyl-CoA-carboxylase] ligase [Gardnerella piotii]MDZ7545128.1 biotin--[acetyl-CoA-carboxylase] ligase [Gardnerella piotii]MDZ7552631.1 biotin--[acetyl-CoA-carboxylase] ligase [Gardnerella piotii]RFT26568.1 biotin--acetyl-CoA-carboxylase ligase [Gardnerella vaginalis]